MCSIKNNSSFLFQQENDGMSKLIESNALEYEGEKEKLLADIEKVMFCHVKRDFSLRNFIAIIRIHAWFVWVHAPCTVAADRGSSGHIGVFSELFWA